MFAKFLEVEIFIELGWGQSLLHKPIFILHNRTSLEVRALNSVIILSRAKRESHVTHIESNKTG